MWSCHKCGKPVYFAERKQSLGYDWHPDCLRCEECGKILKPGQHAEHKGVPYCHVPCYGALFGPQLFGHGTRVESHKSFGKVENKSYGGITREMLETKVKQFNQHYEHCPSFAIKSREVNQRLVLEGVLRLYWGLQTPIQLQEDDKTSDTMINDKPSVTKSYYRRSVASATHFLPDTVDDSDTEEEENEQKTSNTSLAGNNGSEITSPLPKYKTVPSKLDIKDSNWDELDELLQVERQWKDSDKIYQTLPAIPHSQVNENGTSSPGTDAQTSDSQTTDCPSHQRRSNGLRRRPGRKFDKTKLRRRCSINGHFYNRETSVFTPPYGSCMTVWVTSLVSTQEVINMLLDKYKVACPSSNFAIFVVKDNGERRRLRDEEWPLLVRVILGPHEDIVKLYLVEREGSNEVSSAVAQYLNLSDAECAAILRLFTEEEEREVENIREKYYELKKRIKKRMQQLKVKL